MSIKFITRAILGDFCSKSHSCNYMLLDMKSSEILDGVRKQRSLNYCDNYYFPPGKGVGDNVASRNSDRC